METKSKDRFLPLTGTIEFEKIDKVEIGKLYIYYKIPALVKVLNVYGSRAKVLFVNEDLQRSIQTEFLKTPLFVTGFYPWEGSKGVQKRCEWKILDSIYYFEVFKRRYQEYMSILEPRHRKLRCLVSETNFAFIGSLNPKDIHGLEEIITNS